VRVRVRMFVCVFVFVCVFRTRKLLNNMHATLPNAPPSRRPCLPPRDRQAVRKSDWALRSVLKGAPRATCAAWSLSGLHTHSAAKRCSPPHATQHALPRKRPRTQHNTTHTHTHTHSHTHNTHTHTTHTNTQSLSRAWNQTMACRGKSARSAQRAAARLCSTRSGGC
jgi:hypothetical protein